MNKVTSQASSARKEKELCLLLPSSQAETGSVVFRSAQPSAQVNSVSGNTRVPKQDRACFKETLVMEANSIQMTPTVGSFKIPSLLQWWHFCIFYFLVSEPCRKCNTLSELIDWLKELKWFSATLIRRHGIMCFIVTLYFNSFCRQLKLSFQIP